MTTTSGYKHNNLVKRGLIFITALTFIIQACNKDSSGIDTSSYSSVSVYAMIPDAPELSFFMNGSNVATDAPYGSYTLYNRVSPGTLAFRLQSSSRDITADTNFTTSEKSYYSLFITGTTTAILPVWLRDSFPPQDSGYSGMRFLVFAPGVSDIDLHLVKDSANNKTGWSKRSYGSDITVDSIKTFKKFASGTYSFYAISNNNIKDTLAKLGSKTFADSSSYTLLLIGHVTASDTMLYLGSRLH